MPETVYHNLQLGAGAGTMAAPGASVAAKVIFPVTEPVVIDLDRATKYPDREDYGRNVKNHSGRGAHGVRGATFPIQAELTFQNAMELLERHYAGDIVPTAATVSITSNTLANPTVVTTGAAHGMTTGDTTTIAGSNSTPVIDGVQVVTVIDATSFSVAVNVTTAGTTGTATIKPYTWVYPLEAGASTLNPATVETGSESALDQYESVFLIDELTLGFDDLNAPGAHPWMADAACVGLNRVVAALTGSLAAPVTLETMQGHLSLIKLGTTATAFASLTELAASLVAFSVTTRRFIVLRIYGGADGIPTAFAFSEKSTGDITFKAAILSGNKTALLDAWEAAGAVLAEQRLRVTVDGSGNNVAHFDARIGMIKVGITERDGERVYEVTAEIVDDSTLNAPCQLTVVNDVRVLASA